MLVDEEPARSALFPNSRVTNFGFDGFSVFRFHGKVHGDGGPGDGAAARDFQIFAGSERSGGDVVEEIFLDAFSVFLPIVIGEGREIVEDAASILRVKLGRLVGIAAAPGGAIVVGELAESSLIAGLLLGASADEGEKRAEEGETDVEKPAPTLDANRGLRSSRSHPKTLRARVSSKSYELVRPTELACVGIP